MRTTYFALLLALGCSKGLQPADDETEDTGSTETDTDTDTDTDSDSDSDSDSDADTDTDTDAVECAGNYPTPNPGWGGSTCLTGTIGCNQTIEATNELGSFVFDGTDYNDMACRGEDDWEDTFNGPERVYEFYLPADTVADVYLDTPCNTLALRVIQAADRCVHYGQNTNCWSYDSVTPYEQEVTTLLGGVQGRTFQVIVDGINDQVANFRLRTECVSR